MIAPEVIRAFARWCHAKGGSPPLGTYPEWRNGNWYMRESGRASSHGAIKWAPRVWRLEDDFSFTDMRECDCNLRACGEHDFGCPQNPGAKHDHANRA